MQTKFFHTTWGRLLILTILIFGIIGPIPYCYVGQITEERHILSNQTIREIQTNWSNEVRVGSPILVIPTGNRHPIYEDITKEAEYDQNGNEKSKEKVIKRKIGESLEFVSLVADEFTWDGEIQTEVRSRGIYSTPVYTQNAKFSATFQEPKDNEKWKKLKPILQWDNALILIGFSDSIIQLATLEATIDGETKEFGLYRDVHKDYTSIDANTVGTNLKLTSDSLRHFSVKGQIKFRGSEYFRVEPLARLTHIKIKSNWKHPYFSGRYLPEKREITQEGFSAEWTIPRLIPTSETFALTTTKILEIFNSTSNFCVSLYNDNTPYALVERTIKYALLFAIVLFGAFFIIEVFGNFIFHGVQYTLIGGALGIFYVLLLSLSEKLSFSISYCISSFAVTSLITLYCKSLFQSKTQVKVIFLILFTQYLLLFTILRMEDYALITGSVSLFILVSLVMFVTRKVNWYELK